MSCAASVLGAGAAPAQAIGLYCLQSHTVVWRDALAIVQEGGSHEFLLDTQSGQWVQRTFGARAGTTGGGKLKIRDDGSTYRSNWVGLVPETAEALTIDIQGDVIAYHWTIRDQSAEIGICVDAEGRGFPNGEEVEQ